MEFLKATQVVGKAGKHREKTGTQCEGRKRHHTPTLSLYVYKLTGTCMSLGIKLDKRMRFSCETGHRQHEKKPESKEEPGKQIALEV